jgi:hypothetical protein
MTTVKVGSFGWIYIHSHFNLKPMIGLMLMKTCSDLKIKQIFTTWNNPKGNADTARMHQSLGNKTIGQMKSLTQTQGVAMI